MQSVLVLLAIRNSVRATQLKLLKALFAVPRRMGGGGGRGRRSLVTSHVGRNLQVSVNIYRETGIAKGCA